MGALTTKPAPPKWGNLPPFAVESDRWVLYGASKAPLQRTGKDAKSNDPTTWLPLVEARRAYKHGDFHGVGWVPAPEVLFVDIDEPNHELARAFASSGAYVERSPSGVGYHVLALGRKPEGWTNLPTLQVYDQSRQYATMTGDRIDESATDLREIDPDDVALLLGVSFPDVEIPRPEEPKPAPGNMLARRLDAVRNAPEGTRNDSLFRETVGAIEHGEDPELFREAGIESGLEPREVDATIRSAIKKARKNPKPSKSAAKREKELFTEQELGSKLLAANPGFFLWSNIGKRYFWNGTVFAPDEMNAGFSRVRGIVDEYRTRSEAIQAKAEALPLHNPEDGEKNQTRVDLIKYADKLRANHTRYANKRGYQRILDAADTDPSVRCLESDLDQAPYLIATPRKVFDIRSSEWLDPDPGMLLTRCTDHAPVPVDEGADARWLEVLSEIIPDAEHLEYLRRCFGYCATGYTDEKAMVLLLGPGNAGKSLILNTIGNALGSLASPFAWKAFTAGQAAGHSDELASLCRVRFAYAHEVPPLKRVDTATLKSWVSGEPSMVSFKGERSFSMRPTAKFVVSANDAPRIPPDDAAAWNRLFIVECPHPFPKSGVAKEMLTDRMARAVLRWIISGAVDWYADWSNGKPLAVPDSVRSATQREKDAANPLTSWIAERCYTGPDAGRTPTTALFEAYRDDTGDRHMTATAFGRNLNTAGFAAKDAKVGDRTLKCRFGIEVAGCCGQVAGLPATEKPTS